MLPPVNSYLPGGFQGARDIRVKDQANILRVAAWLHHLDLAATYGRAVSESPDVGDYDMGPLLEYFLVPRTSGLTFEEVARRVAQEVKSSLRELHLEWEELWEAVEFLIQSRDHEANKEAMKSLKKRLDLTRRELRSLESQISEQELCLGL